MSVFTVRYSSDQWNQSQSTAFIYILVVLLLRLSEARQAEGFRADAAAVDRRQRRHSLHACSSSQTQEEVPEVGPAEPANTVFVFRFFPLDVSLLWFLWNRAFTVETSWKRLSSTLSYCSLKLCLRTLVMFCTCKHLVFRNLDMLPGVLWHVNITYLKCSLQCV